MGGATIESRAYDVSWIRHGSDVATEQIFKMPVGQRALLKLASGGEDIDKNQMWDYHAKVQEKLVTSSLSYYLGVEMINGKWGLIIEKYD